MAVTIGTAGAGAGTGTATIGAAATGATATGGDAGGGAAEPDVTAGFAALTVSDLVSCEEGGAVAWPALTVGEMITVGEITT
ncbi:hypothetical protein [Phreatobacter sp.]|uniref:hypothetical protein n=1 Tax=Phreatobacter sp. TaxID=1966341 RepID=UPI0025F7E0F6|nr:hypothetical protein [Phreatobacter sp.]